LSSWIPAALLYAVEDLTAAIDENGVVFGGIQSTASSTAKPLFSMRGVGASNGRWPTAHCQRKLLSIFCERHAMLKVLRARFVSLCLRGQRFLRWHSICTTCSDIRSMIWFYTRDRDSLRLETRYDNDALEYVGILTRPDGTRDVKRFATVETFREWLVTLEAELNAQRWTSSAEPQVLPDGWPNKRPPR